MGALDAYLVVYNLGCMAGWAYALFLAAGSLARTGGDLTAVWSDASAPAQIAQWAMLLEIVHALTGAVRSPVFTVFLQVMSRIVALGVALVAPEVQSHWACGLMLISWALVEVPRYAFYLNALLSPKGSEGTLYPVFWLRYSLFSVLYPTGITGECMTMWAACGTPALAALLPNGLAVTLVKLNLAFYLPGAPFMYMNMVKNRKSAFKKRYPPPEKPKPPEKGTQFPSDGKGGRSTTVAGKQVCTRPFQPELLRSAPPPPSRAALPTSCLVFATSRARTRASSPSSSPAGRHGAGHRGSDPRLRHGGGHKGGRPRAAREELAVQLQQALHGDGQALLRLARRRARLRQGRPRVDVQQHGVHQRGR